VASNSMNPTHVSAVLRNFMVKPSFTNFAKPTT
jgi:hypothetical protein